jgi:hypothetical protein
MTMLSDVTSLNYLSNIIYEAPIILPSVHGFKKLKTKIKQHKHFKKTVLPMYYKLRDETASFSTMCVFADFIKQMELSMFFNNSVNNKDNSSRSNIPDEEKKNIIICDNSMANAGKEKVLKIIMEKDNVVITFKMKRDYDDDIIDINVRNGFGSKISSNFHIVNANTDFGDLHMYNLLNNVNSILQNAMAETFLDIYFDAIDRV